MLSSRPPRKVKTLASCEKREFICEAWLASRLLRGTNATPTRGRIEAAPIYFEVFHLQITLL